MAWGFESTAEAAIGCPEGEKAPLPPPTGRSTLCTASPERPSASPKPLKASSEDPFSHRQGLSVMAALPRAVFERERSHSDRERSSSDREKTCSDRPTYPAELRRAPSVLGEGVGVLGLGCASDGSNTLLAAFPPKGILFAKTDLFPRGSIPPAGPEQATLITPLGRWSGG